MKKQQPSFICEYYVTFKSSKLSYNRLESHTYLRRDGVVSRSSAQLRYADGEVLARSELEPPCVTICWSEMQQCNL